MFFSLQCPNDEKQKEYDNCLPEKENWFNCPWEKDKKEGPTEL